MKKHYQQIDNIELSAISASDGLKIAVITCWTQGKSENELQERMIET